MESGGAVINLLSRRRYLLVLAILLGIGAFLVVKHNSRPMYQADARLALGPELSSSQEAQTAVNRARAIATSKQVLGAAIDAANVPRTTDQMSGYVDVTGVGDSGIAQLSVQDSDPAVAAALCRALAKATIDFVNSTNSESLKATLASIDAQLQQALAEYVQVQPKAATGSASSAAQLAAIGDNMNALAAARGQLLARQAQVVPASVIDQPAVLGTRIGSNRGVVAALCAVGALLFWLLAAATMESLRPLWPDLQSIGRYFGAPVLGRMNAEPTADDSQAAEVTDRLILSADHHHSDVVVVASGRGVPYEFAARLETLLRAREDTKTDVQSVPDGRLVGGLYLPAGVEAGFAGNGAAKSSAQVVTKTKRPRLGPTTTQKMRSVLPFELASLAPSKGTGIVVVARPGRPRAHLSAAEELVRCSDWPVIGVIEVVPA